MGVIYAGICIPSGKVYVGKHAHGKRGKSVGYSRWKRHENGSGGNAPIHRAIVRHGADSIEWHVIDLVAEEHLSERERFWISIDGLDTLSPNGYNLHPGGEGGALTEEHRENIKTSLATTAVKERIAFTNQTSDTKKRRSDAMKEVSSRPSVVLAQKERMDDPQWKEWWLTRVHDGRGEDWKERRLQTLSQGSGLEALSAAAKKQRQDEKLESSRRAKFSQTFEDAHNRLYQSIDHDRLLPWPKNSLERLPRPQYYLKDGKIGFSSGKDRRFESIEPQDWNKRKKRKAKNEANRRVRLGTV
jgi:hypothetical protein